MTQTLLSRAFTTLIGVSLLAYTHIEWFLTYGTAMAVVLAVVAIVKAVRTQRGVDRQLAAQSTAISEVEGTLGEIRRAINRG